MKARKVFQGKHVVVLKRGSWEFVERTTAKEAVAIVAITDDNRIILTEQFRNPVNARVIDLPAGLIEHGGPKSTAKRELKEETGYTCRSVELLAKGPTSPGITSEIVHFYRAAGVRRQGAGGGGGGGGWRGRTSACTPSLCARSSVGSRQSRKRGF
jgi:ADP-ribose pyrophosphatase